MSKQNDMTIDQLATLVQSSINELREEFVELREDAKKGFEQARQERKIIVDQLDLVQDDVKDIKRNVHYLLQNDSSQDNKITDMDQRVSRLEKSKI